MVKRLSKSNVTHPSLLPPDAETQFLQFWREMYTTFKNIGNNAAAEARKHPEGSREELTGLGAAFGFLKAAEMMEKSTLGWRQQKSAENMAALAADLRAMLRNTGKRQ